MTVKSAGAPSLLEEVRRQTEVMGRYALETGLEFPGEGERLWGKMEGEISLEELTKLHRILAQRVAPATPLTLEATRGGSLTGRIREVAILKRLSAICLVSLGLFLLCLLLTSLPLPEWCRGVKEVVPVFLASLLGSSFSALFTANRYVVARTFDPRYETTYWSRLWLGVVAGTSWPSSSRRAAAGQDSALLQESALWRPPSWEATPRRRWTGSCGGWRRHWWFWRGAKRRGSNPLPGEGDLGGGVEEAGGALRRDSLPSRFPESRRASRGPGEVQEQLIQDPPVLFPWKDSSVLGRGGVG